MLTAAIKRSPYAHATINSIDTSKALAMDGVVAVYTGQDLIDDGSGSLPCGFNPPDIKTAPHMPLAADKARHVGDGVAVVIAKDSYTAYDALDLIEVDYTKCCLKDHEFIVPSTLAKATYSWYLLGHLVLHAAASRCRCQEGD